MSEASDELTTLLSSLVGNPNRTSAHVVDDFLLARVKPVAGEWYLSSACPVCGGITPFCLDPLRGTLPIPLRGPGGLKSVCVRCGRRIRVPVKRLRSVKYSSENDALD